MSWGKSRCQHIPSGLVWWQERIPAASQEALEGTKPGSGGTVLSPFLPLPVLLAGALGEAVQLATLCRQALGSPRRVGEGSGLGPACCSDLPRECLFPEEC